MVAGVVHLGGQVGRAALLPVLGVGLVHSQHRRLHLVCLGVSVGEEDG